MSYAEINDYEASFEWLDRALAADDIWRDHVNHPVFDPMRADPRWQSMLERLDAE